MSELGNGDNMSTSCIIDLRDTNVSAEQLIISRDRLRELTDYLERLIDRRKYYNEAVSLTAVQMAYEMVTEIRRHAHEVG